ncbi:hypothetical protein E2562_004096 [Oryza meyeriana var. granulata]|uniref:Uncharacterized protein n=1 Tax=Oryza meyeriana var. granulata TaxID=110450 RepID=A0A6G1BIL5_9ORYZ|nr:hypothetical protein E2562_004096 [Oryza meyeriana var. granulata]
MFSRMVVANNAGSWLTSPIYTSSHLSQSHRMSTPSSATLPADDRWQNLTLRNSTSLATFPSSSPVSL